MGRDDVHSVKLRWLGSDGEECTGVHHLTRYVPYFPALLRPATARVRRQQILKEVMRAAARSGTPQRLLAARMTLGFRSPGPAVDGDGFRPLPAPIDAHMITGANGVRLLIFTA